MNGDANVLRPPASLEAVRRGFAGLLGRPLAEMIPLAGGRNSRVFQLVAADGTAWAGKAYLQDPADPRPRLTTEFRGLSFLWSQGVRRIPRPVAVDVAQGLAVYGFVAGSRIPSGTVAPEDIDRAVAFLAELQRAGRHPAAAALPLASAACLSVADIHAAIGARLARLLAVPRSVPAVSALQEFLQRDFLPAYGRIRQWCEKALRRWGRSGQRPLPVEERVLSPSDFGFHNALRLDDGSLIFLDFEYFGWDDPAKTVVDFVLHPGMGLTRELGMRFAEGVFAIVSRPLDVRRRSAVYYPLLGLVWCLILLNEFLPHGLARRRFAAAAPFSPLEEEGDIHGRQLMAARTMLHRILETYAAGIFGA